MAMAAGQICLERFTHAGQNLVASFPRGSTWFIYCPTGAGDWFRWRVRFHACFPGESSAFNAYPVINGCSRGYVYAGARKTYADANTVNQMASTETILTSDYCIGYSAADYRNFNLVTGSTHARAWFLCATGYGTATITFRDASHAILATHTVDTAIGTGAVMPSAWFAVPANTAYMRVAGSGTQINFIGMDWINKSSITTPDVAGSLMDDSAHYGIPAYRTGTAVPVLVSDAWGPSGVGSGVTACMDLVCFWNDIGGSLDSAKAWGGDHKGIKGTFDTAHVQFNWQTDDQVYGTWGAATPGAKLKAETFQMCFVSTGTNDLRAYLESAATNIRGTVTGSNNWDANGVRLKRSVIVDADPGDAGMLVFQLYSGHFMTPADVDRVLWLGDTQERINSVRVDGATTTCGWKSPFARLRGTGNDTLYFATMPGLYQQVVAAYYPRLTYNSSFAGQKYYANGLITDGGLDYAHGASIETDVALHMVDAGMFNTSGAASPVNRGMQI